MSFTPSVRECLLRLDRMRDTGQVIADLQRLNDELWRRDGGATELNAAIPRLRELHQLALHMAANLNGGAAVPATPTAPPKVAGAASTAVQKPSIATWTTAVAAQRAHNAKYGAVAPSGMVGMAEFQERLGVSNTFFYRMLQDGRVSRPSTGGGGGKRAYWLEKVVAETVQRLAQEITPRTRRASARPAPQRAPRAQP